MLSSAWTEQPCLVQFAYYMHCIALEYNYEFVVVLRLRSLPVSEFITLHTFFNHAVRNVFYISSSRIVEALWCIMDICA